MSCLHLVVRRAHEKYEPPAQITKLSLTTEDTERTEMEKDLLTEKIIGCAIEVHRNLGPGLLESAYHRCLIHELTLQGVQFQSEMPMPVIYKGLQLDCGYRIDVLVDRQVILELKSVERVTGIHEAQLLTYLRLAKVERGLLINFNVRRLVDGVKRYRI